MGTSCEAHTQRRFVVRNSAAGATRRPNCVAKVHFAYKVASTSTETKQALFGTKHFARALLYSVARAILYGDRGPVFSCGKVEKKRHTAHEIRGPTEYETIARTHALHTVCYVGHTEYERMHLGHTEHERTARPVRIHHTLHNVG